MGRGGDCGGAGVRRGQPGTTPCLYSDESLIKTLIIPPLLQYRMERAGDVPKILNRGTSPGDRQSHAV